MKFGRDEREWSQLVDAATDYLIEVARGRSLATYPELSAELVRRTGFAGFNYDMERDRAAVGALLGEVTDRTLDEIGAMLSSLIVQKATGDPGEGFYRFARKLGLLTSGVEKFEFMQSQVAQVHRHYAR